MVEFKNLELQKRFRIFASSMVALLLVVSMMGLVGCGAQQKQDTKKTDTSTSSSSDTKKADEKEKAAEKVEIKQSPDKYTHYIKNYVGKNCASIGNAYDDKLRDEYGHSGIKLALVSADGEYIDVNDKDALKNYKVTAQSVAPNTEMKYTYVKYSDGKESSNLVESQSIEEIELTVAKVKSETKDKSSK